MKAEYDQKLSLMQSAVAVSVVSLQEKIAQDKENRKLYDKIGMLQRNIERAGRRLDAAYRTESDKRKIPEPLKPMVGKMLDTFLSKSGKLMFDLSGEEGKRRLAEMSAAYTDLSRRISDLEMDTSMLDADNVVVFANLGVMLDRYNELIQGKGSHSKEALLGRAEILQHLSDLVTNIAGIVTRTNESIVNGHKVTYQVNAQDAANEMKSMPNHRYIKGKAGRMIDMIDSRYGTGNVTPYYFFKWLKNSAMSRAFAEQRTSENNWGLRMGEAQSDL